LVRFAAIRDFNTNDAAARVDVEGDARIGAPKATRVRRFRRLAPCDVGSALAWGVRRSLCDRSVAK